MRAPAHVRSALTALAALALLTACGAQNGASIVPQPATTADNKAPGSYGDLLYVLRYPNVLIYTYPGAVQVGTLQYGGYDLCADGSGNVFVVDSTYIYEYAHGGTEPINTLGSGSPYSYLGGCSVDPTTGDLAVPSNYGLAVFKHAQGKPKYYQDSDFNGYFKNCGYDGSGNLFADGYSIRKERAAIAELTAGSGSLQTLVLNQKIRSMGVVQWDGTYMTIAAEKRRDIYRFVVSGSAANVVGSTTLTGAGSRLFKTWIYNGAVIAPFSVNKHGYHATELGYWNYPAGGSPEQTFKGGSGSEADFTAVTISPGS